MQRQFRRQRGTFTKVEGAAVVNCSKKFWKRIRRLNVRNSKKNRNLLEVLDEDEILRTGE